jgi:F0F1-type ATP synthase assembly protein I
MKYIFLIILVLTSLVSCTVTKRVHRNGIHIQWNSLHKNSNATNKAEFFQAIEAQETSEDEIETVEIMIEDDPAILRHEKIKDISPIEKRENKIWNTSPVLSSNKEEISILKSVSKKFQTKKNKSIAENKDQKFRIDWDMVGFIALLLLLGTLVALAFFATSPWAQIAAIIIALLGLAMIIVAVYYIGYFFWFIFFGWWM